MKRYARGFTQGTYDMFHVGHLNILLNAKEQCEYLIVGVNANSLVKTYKHKTPVINEKDRARIVANIKVVDECVITTTLDKVDALKKYNFDVVFIGDDWKGNYRWEQTTEELAQYGVDVVFLPHTEGISSTELRLVTDEIVDE